MLVTFFGRKMVLNIACVALVPSGTECRSTNLIYRILCQTYSAYMNVYNAARASAVLLYAHYINKASASNYCFNLHIPDMQSKFIIFSTVHEEDLPVYCILLYEINFIPISDWMRDGEKNPEKKHPLIN